MLAVGGGNNNLHHLHYYAPSSSGELKATVQVLPSPEWTTKESVITAPPVTEQVLPSSMLQSHRNTGYNATASAGGGGGCGGVDAQQGSIIVNNYCCHPKLGR